MRIQSTVPSEKLRELEALKAEIHLDDWSAEGASHGMFRRFFVADDVNVDRFIIRDSDSRLERAGRVRGRGLGRVCV